MKEETKERMKLLAEIIYLREENKLLKLMMRGVEYENTRNVQKYETSKML